MPDEPVAQNDDEVVVTITDDPAPAPAGVGDGGTPAPADAVEDIKQQHAVLTEQTQREAQLRMEAEQRATTAEAELQTTKASLLDTQISTAEAGMSAAQAELDGATAEQQAAYEAGDFAKVAKLNGTIAKASSRLTMLEQQKIYLEQAKTSGAEAPITRTDQQPSQRPADPVEAYIRNRTPPTAAWLRAHADFITDPRKQHKLSAAHFNAIADGMTVDTPAYFDHVEQFLGLRQKAAPTPSQGQRQQTTPKVPARPTVPAAPVGGNGSGPGGASNEVRLTKGEAAAATDGTHVWNYDDPSGKKAFKKGDPIGIQEMARRKRAMMQSGQYDRVYETQ